MTNQQQHAITGTLPDSFSQVCAVHLVPFGSIWFHLIPRNSALGVLEAGQQAEELAAVRHSVEAARAKLATDALESAYECEGECDDLDDEDTDSFDGCCGGGEALHNCPTLGLAQLAWLLLTGRSLGLLEN